MRKTRPLVVAFAMIAMAPSAFAIWTGTARIIHRFPWFDSDLYLAPYHDISPGNDDENPLIVIRGNLGLDFPTENIGFKVANATLTQTIDIDDETCYITEIRTSSCPELKDSANGYCTLRSFLVFEDKMKNIGGSISRFNFDAHPKPYVYDNNKHFNNIRIHYSVNGWYDDAGSRRVIVSYAPLNPETKKETGPYLKLLSSTKDGAFTLSECPLAPKKAGTYRFRMNTLHREYTADITFTQDCF